MTAFNTAYELRTSPKLLSFLLLYTNMHTYIIHTRTYAYRGGEREKERKHKIGWIGRWTRPRRS